MDITKIIAALREERERVDAAIMSIERLVKVKDGSIKKRGRPPGSKNKPKAGVPQG
jgi:hypothetical protein